MSQGSSLFQSGTPTPLRIPTDTASWSSGRLPIIGINGYRRGVEAPFFSCDDRIAGEHAVRHLASLGHRTIGFISGPHRFTPVQRRLEWYQRTMRDLFGNSTRRTSLTDEALPVRG